MLRLMRIISCRQCTIWYVSNMLRILSVCSKGYKAYLLFNIPAK